MENYEFSIDGKIFKYSDPLEADQNDALDDFSYLELLCNLAPVYYLYKFKNEKSLYEILGKYALLCMYTTDIFYEIRRFLKYRKNIKISHDDPSTIPKFIELTILRLDDQLEQDSFESEAKNLIIQSEPQISFLINEIIDICKTKSGRYDFKVYYRLYKLIEFIDPEFALIVYKIKINIGFSWKTIIQALFSNGATRLNFITICRCYINNFISILSITISPNQNEINKLEELCKSVLVHSYKIKSHFGKKCLAIVNHKGKEYFAISGTEDYQNNNLFYTRIKKWADDANGKLFNNNAQWCNLSNNTCNYIEKTQSFGTIKETNFKYIGPTLNNYELLASEKNPDDYLDFYKCCERKILGFNLNMQGFDLFVLIKPCFRCSKALYSKVNKIYAYFEKLDWRKAIEKGKNFVPKEYYISQVFDSKEI